MINVPAGTAATKPAFRDAFVRVRRSSGVWERRKDAGGKWVKTCSILTTTPNAVTSTVHDRMPVILDPDAYDVGLDPGMTNVAAASGQAGFVGLPISGGR